MLGLEEARALERLAGLSGEGQPEVAITVPEDPCFVEREPQPPDNRATCG